MTHENLTPHEGMPYPVSRDMNEYGDGDPGERQDQRPMPQPPRSQRAQRQRGGETPRTEIEANEAINLPLDRKSLRIEHWLAIGDSEEEAARKAEQEIASTTEGYNPIGFTKELVRNIPNDTDINELRARLSIKKGEEGQADIVGDLYGDVIRFVRGTIDRRSTSEDQIKEITEDYARKLDEVLKETSVEGMKRRLLTTILDPLDEARDKLARSERGFTPYENINQILEDIMVQSGADYAREGKYALIKSEKGGTEVIQEANLLRWLRDRMIEYHESDVDNPVDMFQRIGVMGGARETSIGEWIFKNGFWTTVDGKYLGNLKSQIYYELWLFNTSRDVDAIYRRVMGDDAELPKKLTEIYFRNTFTKEATMDTILTLPDTSEGTEIDFEGDRELVRENQRTGQALRRALLSYYHIGDIEMLNKIEGAGNQNATALFDNKVFVEQYAKSKMKGQDRPEDSWSEDRKQKFWDDRAGFLVEGMKIVRNTEKFLDPNKRAIRLENEIRKSAAMKQTMEDLQDKDDDTPERKKEKIKLRRRRAEYELLLSSLRGDCDKYERELPDRAKRESARRKKEVSVQQLRQEEYMSSLNPFSVANKPFDLRNETKERVRLLIMDAAKISYEEAKYAETFAFSMARWTGFASRHDPTATAYDSWSKVTETEQYRLRQSEEFQGGIHGNPYSLGGFKRMGLDFLAGACDLEGRSILEIIQGGQGDRVDLETGLKEIKFGDRVMEKFGTDHIARVFKLYEDIISSHEFNFDKIVSIDNWGRVTFDPKAATEFIDGPLKAFRYAYRTWAGTNYSKLIRVKDPKSGEIRTMSIAESMWGKQVYKDFVNGADRDGSLRRGGIEERDENGNVIDTRAEMDGEVIQKNRVEFWKRPLMYMIAAEIYAHREHTSGFSKYKLAEVQKIYEWLGNFSGELEYDDNDLRNTKRNKDRMFFSPEEIQWMRRASDTTTGFLYFTEATSQGTVGLLEGAGKGLKTFIKSLGLSS